MGLNAVNTGSTGMLERGTVQGRVHWELVDDLTGKITSHGDGIVERFWLRLLPLRLRRE